MVFVARAYLEKSSLKTEPKSAQQSVKIKPMKASRRAKPTRAGHWPLIVGENVRLHGHYAVDIYLRVHELQHQPGEEAAFRLFAAFRDRGAPEGLPGQIEHVCRAYDQHWCPYARDEVRERAAEGCTEQHDHREPRPDAQVEGQGAPEAQPSRVGQAHEVVRPRVTAVTTA